MAERKCPICDKPAALPKENRWFPFCSERCQVIDLGKWLSGDYRIPVSDEDDGGGGGGTAPTGEGGSGTLH